LIPDNAGAIGGETNLIKQIQEVIDECEMENECENEWRIEKNVTNDDNSVDADMSDREFNAILNTTCADLPTMDEYPTTPTRKEIPPGSLLSDEARPPSPTNISDFPYYEPWVGEDQNIHVPVRASTVQILPRVLASIEDVSDAIESMNLEKDSTSEI
jgi:hypothetical protein